KSETGQQHQNAHPPDPAEQMPPPCENNMRAKGRPRRETCEHIHNGLVRISDWRSLLPWVFAVWLDRRSHKVPPTAILIDLEKDRMVFLRIISPYGRFDNHATMMRHT